MKLRTIIVFCIVALQFAAFAISKVYVNKDNITIADGKPFFPLGLFVGNGPETNKAIKELDEIADSPFNTIMNYNINSGSIDQIRHYLDAVDKHSLKIIYSIKDFYEGSKYYPGKVGTYVGEDKMTRGVITEFRAHPAILAWYLNDELSSTYMPRLIKRYKLVKNLDPNHPAWIVIYQVNELRSYLATTDIIGTDPYPVPHKPISMAGEWAKLTRKAAGDKRAVWMVPQAHNTSLYSKGKKYAGPTSDEMRCMTYQCLVNGANGLIFYSYFDLKRDPLGFEKRWSEVKNLGAEIKSLAPVLLSTETAPKVKLSSGIREINYSAKRYNGKLYIMAVNTSDREHDAEFIISEEAKDARVMFEDRSVPIEKYRLKDRFPPIVVHVYEIKVSSIP